MVVVGDVVRLREADEAKEHLDKLPMPDREFGDRCLDVEERERILFR